MAKMAVSDRSLLVTFDANRQPLFVFNGDWNVRDLIHTRVRLFRAYKHYIKEVRIKLEAAK
jgi:hypothetical protein